MKRPLTLLLFALVSAGLEGEASGQTRPALRLELLPVISSARGEFASSAGGVGAGAGYGIGGAGVLGWGRIAGFAGYRMSRFGCEQCGDLGLDEHVGDEGWEAGARVGRLSGGTGPRYWLQAGAIGHTLTFSGLDSELESDRGIGYLAGGGVGMRAPFGLEAFASVGYRSYRVSFGFEPIGLNAREVDVSYLDAGVGVGFVF